MSFQIFLLVGHLTNWTGHNLLTDNTLKKRTQDVLVTCSVIMSDHNVKLAGHFQNLVGQCPMTDCYFQHCMVHNRKPIHIPPHTRSLPVHRTGAVSQQIVLQVHVVHMERLVTETCCCDLLPRFSAFIEEYILLNKYFVSQWATRLWVTCIIIQ